LVILNPDFVKRHSLDIVTGKSYKKLRSILPKLSIHPLIWACEIIYFPKTRRIPQNAIKIIKQDTFKIKETINGSFCRIGSVHVLTCHPREEATQLQYQVAHLVEREFVEVILTTAGADE